MVSIPPEISERHVRTMSETPKNPTLTRNSLTTLMAVLAPTQNGKVARYKNLAHQLSIIAGRSPPWTWRYLQGVLAGTLSPSPAFAQAVLALQMATQKVSSIHANLELVQVYARPGTVQPGALVVAESRPCACPTCPICFVPVSPEQIYCPNCQNSF